jgi:hypothetical protein
MSNDLDVRPAVTTSRGVFFKIALVLTLATLVVGSLRFARYDWSGIPLERAPMHDQVRLSKKCLEKIGPYTTESGRVIAPVVVDEQQYLALVEYFRGTPRSELLSGCLYDPFTNRSGTAWLAHFLPVEEGLAMGITTTTMLLLGLWFVIGALRAGGAGPRTILAVGALYGVSWNTLMFGTAIMVDVSVVAAIALCWYLISTRRVWWVWPILFLGYPLKETIGIVVPVIWAWSLAEYRSGRKGVVKAAAPSVAATVALVVGVVMWRHIQITPDARWEALPSVNRLINNLTDPINPFTFFIGVLPLFIPAFLRARRMVRADGWFNTAVDPAVVGVLVAVGVCLWTLPITNISSRVFWIGCPFAASLAAQWFATGRGERWLDAIRLPRWLVGDPDPVPAPASDPV